MCSKKRSPNSTDGVEFPSDTSMHNNIVSDPLKKKMRKEKGKDNEDKVENGDANTHYSTLLDSAKPMERKKKRKTLDKERKRVILESGEVKGKPGFNSKFDETRSSSVSVSSSGLPEFHIGVFKDLASADILVRESAAEALAMELQKVQEAYDRIENKDLVESGLKLEAEKDDGLDNCAPSVRYAVRRLIRGVSSSRECARQGFALGLTTLIGTLPCIKVDSLLKLIVNLLEVSSSMKGQEAKDCLLGRLFAYGAIVHSGRLTNEYFSDLTTSHVKEMTSVLISLATKKRYLQEPAVSIIVELIEKLTSAAVLNHVLEAPGVREWFEAAIEIGYPDALLLALKVREKISVDSPVFSKILPIPFNPSSFFAADHLSSLVNCLKESTFCQPRVHSLWPVLLNVLLPDTILQAHDSVSVSSSLKKHKKNRKGGSSEEEILINFQNFFEVVIEGTLLLSSHDRKHLVFDVLLLLLPKLPTMFVPAMLSYKIVQCLMDILSTKDSWLYKVAQHFLKEVSDWVLYDDNKRVSVILALQKHSHGKFDCITRTKTVQNLMSEFKSETGCLLFIQNLMSMFVDESPLTEEPSDQSQTTDDNSEIGYVEDKDSIGIVGNSVFLRSWMIESLPCILKHMKLEPESKFRVQKEILKFLAVQGLFTASLGTEVTSFELQEKFKWPKAPTSTALCKICIEQLQLLLANSQKGDGTHGLMNGLESNDLGSYFMRFHSTLHNIPSVSLFRRLSDEDEDAFKKLQEMETWLWKEEKNYGLSADANKLHALRYLLVQLLLQVLLQPEEFHEAATELIICCKKAFTSADLLVSSGDDESDVDGTPQLMDVLVDTLLSLLPPSSAPMRSAIEQVFKYFCDDITDYGLMRMLRIVKKNLKPSRHRNVEDGNNDGDEDEDFLDVEEDEEIDEVGTSDTGESDGHTDESEVTDRVGRVEKELSDATDDSDGGMDDDAMFRMDSYLAQMLKERKSQAGSESAQSQLLLFKLRVLSLLEIYLHENPGKPQVLLVFSNLAQALVSPQATEGSEQLEQRIWGILQKKIFRAKDYPKGEAVLLSTLEHLLEKNLKLASKPFKRKKFTANLSKKKQSAWNRYKMISSLAQNSTFWILKIIDAKKLSNPELREVFDIFDRVLVEYFQSKKSQVKSEFLKEIIRRRTWVGHHLFHSLIRKCGNTSSEFRRVEALDLIVEILRSSSSENRQEATKKLMDDSLLEISNLIKVLLTNMPEKQTRRAEVRKFCGKIFHFISSFNLNQSFLESLAPEALAACEAQLGEQFTKLK